MALQVRGQGEAEQACDRAGQDGLGHGRHGGSALKGRRLQYRHLCMQQQISPSSG